MMGQFFKLLDGSIRMQISLDILLSLRISLHLPTLNMA